MNTHIHLWEQWALLVARLMLAFQFAVAAYYKLTLFPMQVAQTAAVGVPLASLAVALALILEVVGIIALLTGYYVRPIAVLLAGYVMLLAILFYRGWSDPMVFGMFVSHLGMTAALLYVSVFGANRQ